MLTADDRFAILDVIARYNNSCDAFDLDDALVALTENVHIVLYGNNSEEPMAIITGHSQLKQALEPRHKHHLSIGVQVRHLIQNPQFLSSDGTLAELRAQVVVLYQRAADPVNPKPRMVQSGTYHYHLRRTDIGWRIAGLVARSCGVYSADAVYDLQC